MLRKIFSWVLIVPSVLLLVLSLAGIGASWIYNQPLTREATSRLKEIDGALLQAQSTLASTQLELERALRIVDAAGQALEKLAEQCSPS
jgi:hypothetical protein